MHTFLTLSAPRMGILIDLICNLLKPSEIAAIPPTSIMREFIDGQTL